jgi:hypothetical protein
MRPHNQVYSAVRTFTFNIQLLCKSLMVILTGIETCSWIICNINHSCVRRIFEFYWTIHNNMFQQLSPAISKSSVLSAVTTRSLFFVVKGPAADVTDGPQPWGLLRNPVIKTISFFFTFPSNVAPVEWNWQEKTDVLGEKPVPVPLCPPQMPHGLSRDRTRASAVRGRRLTVWTMARPQQWVTSVLYSAWQCFALLQLLGKTTARERETIGR